MPSMDQGLALRAGDARDAMTVAFADEDQERAIVHEQKRANHCDKYAAGRPRNVRCRLRPLWSDSGTRVANQIPCSAKDVVGVRIREYGPCEVPSRAAHVCRGRASHGRIALRSKLSPSSARGRLGDRCTRPPRLRRGPRCAWTPECNSSRLRAPGGPRRYAPEARNHLRRTRRLRSSAGRRSREDGGLVRRAAVVRQRVAGGQSR
jgi:hypothetical protein